MDDEELKMPEEDLADLTIKKGDIGHADDEQGAEEEDVFSEDDETEEEDPDKDPAFEAYMTDPYGEETYNY